MKHLISVKSNARLTARARAMSSAKLKMLPLKVLRCGDPGKGLSAEEADFISHFLRLADTLLECDNQKNEDEREAA
jgi:hypothetical protein